MTTGMSDWNGRTAVVTGANGFIGANLVRGLLASGASVIAVVRETSDVWRLPADHPALAVVRAPLRAESSSLVTVQTSKVDWVFHTAAAAVNQTVRDVPAMIEANVGGTIGALEMAERLAVQRFVYVGSSGEYGPCVRAREDQLPAPNAEYGATKAAGWLLAHAFGRRTGLSVVSVRPFSVYGAFEAAYRLVPYCTLCALDDIPMNVTSGRQSRDFVFVDDVIEGIKAAAVTPAADGQTLNLCTGIDTTVREMVVTIARVCRAKAEPVFGAAPALTTEMWTTSGDPRRAGEVLGWAPRHTIEDGLAKVRDWLAGHRARYSEYARR